MSEYEYDIKTESPKKSKKKKNQFLNGFLVGTLTTFLVMCFIGTCFVFLYFLGKAVTPSQDINAIVGANGLGENDVMNQKVISKVSLLEKTIDKYFYLEKKTDEELRTGMYKGMLEALDDPYSEYYTEEELTELMNDSDGIYFGIGAYISLDADTAYPKISGVISGAPAEDAKLRTNDIIYKVDGESVHGMSLTEVVSRIKGEEGTEVVLTIVREGETDYIEVPVKRAKVESPTVTYEKKEDGIAYIQITQFDKVTTSQFKDAYEQAKEDGMQGLIIDLRANPGGNLSTVVDICRMILPEGIIVYTEDGAGERVDYTCDGKNEIKVPLTVLVDGNSASASEIMAGAIKDYGVGTLVGTTTFGKGIVQQIIPFSDGSAVKLTISSYFTPHGNNIHGIGIEPDVVCEFDGETYYSNDDHYDNQLEKAKEVLLEKMK